MPRVLVIGGTLFIGRALVDKLLERGDAITIMHRNRGHPYGERVGEIRCDRNDIAAVQAALDGERFDVVYDNVYDWERGTTAEQVLAAVNAVADGLHRYVFLSSVGAYGDTQRGLLDEDSELAPDSDPSIYSRQKAQSERALFELHRTRGVPVSTLRPAFAYGPFNPYPRESFFWDRMLDDRPIIIPEDGSRVMQWVHCDDIALSEILAAEQDVAIGRAYNVAGPPITQVEFVEACARAAGRKPKLVFIPRARIEAAGGQLMTPPFYFGAYLDIPPVPAKTDRAREELGIELRTLDQGLRDTFHWYEQQPRTQWDYSWEDQLIAANS